MLEFEMVLFYWEEVCIWFVGVEDFVAVHYCDEIFCVREVYYIVGVAWQHVDCFYLVSADFKVQHLVASDSTLLDEAVAAHYDEEFPFGVMPVLSFGDARLADVDADLSAVECVNEFSK